MDKHQSKNKTNVKKRQKQEGYRRTPFRLLAMVLAFTLAMTLLPTERMLLPVQAEETAQTESSGNTLVKDGGAVTWDFTDGNAAIYTSQVDGSLSVSGSISYKDGQHGANIGNDTVFTLSVPEGQTTITFGVCAYGSSTAAISVEGKEIGTITLNGADPDGAESKVKFTSETAAQVTIAISGNGYLHSITAETITPVAAATVSGTVTNGDAVAGQTLVFTDTSDAAKTYETTITNSGYSISLPIGTSYTVDFENAAVYEVSGGTTVDLTTVTAGETVTNNITYTVLWNASKTFGFTIGGTAFTVTPGASDTEDFTVTASGGTGSVELATTDTAIIWANLQGAGLGTLTTDTLKNVNDSVTYTLGGNTITFTYKDADSSPKEYKVQVKDNSASGTPSANGKTTTYSFSDGSIVSQLYKKGSKYSIPKGSSVSSLDGLVTVHSENGIQSNGDAHGIIVKNGDYIRVKVAGDATVSLANCAFSASGSTWEVSAEAGTVSPKSASAKGDSDGDDSTFSYTGEATTLTFTYTGSGSGYLHSLSVTNEVAKTGIKEQEAMPEIMTYGNGLTVTAAGQQLYLKQEGGALATGNPLSNTVGYYGFPATADMNKLEADVMLTKCGSSSQYGIFVGAFDETDIETMGIRNSTNVRGIYTTSGSNVSAGVVDASIEAGATVHFTVERTSAGIGITAETEDGTTYSMTRNNTDGLLAEGANAQISFGFVLAGASATITNMKYYDASGNALYDQNDCYAPIGTAPVVFSVQAEALATRDGIRVTWNSSVLADGDGCYVVEVRKDGGNWQQVAVTKETSYLYPTAEAGKYEFRVGGKLGSNGTVTYCEQLGVVEDFVPALSAPTISLTANTDSIQVTWTAVTDATRYQVYRYSSDEGAEAAQNVYTADVNTVSWKDTNVEAEVPYYYYVVAE